jgi:hypothetical protein
MDPEVSRPAGSSVKGGHLAEDLLFQGLNTLEVLWRSVSEFLEAPEPETVGAIDLRKWR